MKELELASVRDLIAELQARVDGCLIAYVKSDEAPDKENPLGWYVITYGELPLKIGLLNVLNSMIKKDTKRAFKNYNQETDYDAS